MKYFGFKNGFIFYWNNPDRENKRNSRDTLVQPLLILTLFADTILSRFFWIQTFLLHSTELTRVIKPITDNAGGKSYIIIYIIQIENRFTSPTAMIIHWQQNRSDSLFSKTHKLVFIKIF